jgi:hypothetical protein
LRRASPHTNAIVARTEARYTREASPRAPISELGGGDPTLPAPAGDVGRLCDVDLSASRRTARAHAPRARVGRAGAGDQFLGSTIAAGIAAFRGVRNCPARTRSWSAANARAPRAIEPTRAAGLAGVHWLGVQPEPSAGSPPPT